MMLAVQLFGILSECLIITYFLCKYFGYKNPDHSNIKSFCFFVFISIYDYISGKFASSDLIMVLGFVAITFIFAFFMLKGNIFEKIAICALDFILIAAINLPILAVSSAITNQFPDVLLTDLGWKDIYILDTFLSKIFYFGIVQAILMFCKKEKVSLKAREWLVITTSFLILIVIASLIHIILITQSTEPIIYMLITLAVSVLVMIILIFIIWVNRSSLLYEENIQIKLRLEKQSNEVQLINKKYEEISMLQHDFKKHIHNIDQLLDKNELTEAKSYMKQLLNQQRQQKKSFFHTVNSNQTILDSLINEKIHEANEHGIELTCRLVTVIPEALQMDVCSILTNLIDNAIENSPASSGCAKIIVIIQNSHGYYRITVRNKITTSVLQYNHNLHTKKANQNEHGWGLKSVQHIAKEHGGSVDIYEENGEFVVAVMLMEE